MERKFKDGLYRLTQLSTATMLLALMLTPQSGLARLLLGLCALGLAIAALTQRQVVMVSRVIVPSLLSMMLALLLYLAPEHHAMWLWGWAVILALPQLALLRCLNAILAGFCWWQVMRFTGLEQGLLAGVLLIALMLLGLARGYGVHVLRQDVTGSLATPDVSLSSARQLNHDLPHEIARCAREGSHGELLLLRSRRAHQPALAGTLATTTRSYENRYHLDRHTLGVVLVSRDIDEARQRRDVLLEALPPPCQARFVMLAPALSLPSQLTAIANQEQTVVMLEEPS